MLPLYTTGATRACSRHDKAKHLRFCAQNRGRKTPAMNDWDASQFLKPASKAHAGNSIFVVSTKLLGELA